MSASITVTPTPEQIEASLRRWGSLLGDFAGFFRGLSRLVERGIEKHIETGGEWSGPPLATLSRAYAEWKEAHFPGRPTLVQTGALRASLRSGGSGNIRKVGANLADFGTSVEYADEVAEERPVIRMPPQFDDLMTELYGAFVVLKMREASVPLEWVSGTPLAALAAGGASESALIRAAAARLGL